MWATCAAGVAVTTTNPFYLLPLWAAAWIVHVRHQRPGATALSFGIFLRFGLAAIVTRTALVLFDIAHVSRGTVAAAALEGLRLATILVVYGTFNSVTDPFRVLRLAPRRFHEPALAAALALSMAPRTIQAAARVREAQRLRGMRRSGWRALPALAVPVLETGMEEAVTLAESMDARGHGRGPRSRYRPDAWTWRSTATAAVGAAALGAFIAVAADRGDSGLAVSTFPLVWPQASGILVGAVLMLAAPGFVAPDAEDRLGVPAGAPA